MGKSARASSRRRRTHARKQPLLPFGATRPFVVSSVLTNGQIGIDPSCNMQAPASSRVNTRARAHAHAHTSFNALMHICTYYACIPCLYRRPQVHMCTREHARTRTRTRTHTHTRQSMLAFVCTHYSNYERIPCACLRLGVDATYIDARRRMHRYGGLVPHTAPSVSRHTRHTYFAPSLSIHTKHAHVK